MLRTALLPLLLSVAAVTSLVHWHQRAGAITVARRDPAPRREAGRETTPDKTTFAVRRTTGPGRPGTSSQRWPGFRGPERTNRTTATMPLAETWPAGGPPRRWQRTLGEGHAGPAVDRGRVYLLDYDEAGERDALRCLSLRDGAEIWRCDYPVRIKRQHGISRTVPAVRKDYVVTIGPKCHVLCVQAESGEVCWTLDMVRRYGTRVPLWYTAQCPLIEDGAVVLAPGGSVLLTALDCATGRVRWETPNPQGWNMSHASVMPMTVGGEAALVYTAPEGVLAVRARGEAAGAVLWQTTEWHNRVTAPSPVALGSGRLLLTAGYGGGSAWLQIAPAGDRAALQARFPKTVFACEQHTPIQAGDVLYSVLPKDAGTHRMELTCFSLTAGVRWHSGPEHRFGLGPFLLVDDRMLLLDDRGVLTMARVSPAGFVPLARAEIFADGRDAWGPMAFVDGLLLLRDATRLYCLDLRAEAMP